MEIFAIRTYHQAGTNGLLSIAAAGYSLCRTRIALSSKQDGRILYPGSQVALRMLYSHKFGHQLEVIYGQL